MSKPAINVKDAKKVTKALECFLADSYAVYIKTHHFHWNVTGPMFNDLHAMFQTQYEDLAIAVDDIAERIRMHGVFIPASFSRFAELTVIKDQNSIPEHLKMVAELSNDHVILAQKATEVIHAAQECDDEGTADFATGRLQIHEKTAWMLKSILG